MKTLSGCRGRQCDIERGLPLARPALALGLMFLVALATPVAMMVG